MIGSSVYGQEILVCIFNTRCRASNLDVTEYKRVTTCVTFTAMIKFSGGMKSLKICQLILVIFIIYIQ